MAEIRIGSLISSATEILFSLGLGDFIVARSHECDFPAAVQKIPQVTSPKFPTDGMSYEIDQRIRSILQEGLSVYRVDAQKLKELNLTHIITQTQCHICAVSLTDVQCALTDWMQGPAEIVNLDGRDIEGVLRDIRRVATALSVETRGEELLRSMKSRMQSIWNKSREKKLHKKLFLVEWIDPLLSAGHWMPEIAEMAGLELIFSEKGGATPPLRWADIQTADPDLIVFAPCGWSIDRSLQELRSEGFRPEGWQDLRAVRENQVFVCDGNQFFNRPGPRLVETTEILAEIAHPQIFSFGHENSSWRCFQNLGNVNS